MYRSTRSCRHQIAKVVHGKYVVLVRITCMSRRDGPSPSYVRNPDMTDLTLYYFRHHLSHAYVQTIIRLIIKHESGQENRESIATRTRSCILRATGKVHFARLQQHDAKQLM